MRTNRTRYVILGLLSREPMSGYDIGKIIRLRFRFFWRESYGQIYPQLERLAAEGLVRREAGKSGSRRARKVYGITEKGKKALVDWLRLPPANEVRRYEILLKFYFGDLLTDRRLTAFLEQFRRDHEAELQLLDLMAEELRQRFDEHDNHPYILMAVDLGRRVNRAYLEWADAAIAELSAIHPRKEET